MDESPVVEKHERMKLGPIFAIALLVIIFAIGGAYFFVHEKARLNTPPIQETINA
jgi:hypothetical protein